MGGKHKNFEDWMKTKFCQSHFFWDTLYIFRNTMTFIKRSKAGDVEMEYYIDGVVDDNLKSEIQALRGSVFDLYLESMNIRQCDI
jgi:hypothetical protein